MPHNSEVSINESLAGALSREVAQWSQVSQWYKNMSLPSNTAGLGTPSISPSASSSASNHGTSLGTSGRNPCTPQNLDVVSSFSGDGMFLACDQPRIGAAGVPHPATIQGLDS
jgi:hypothetical protein